MAAPKSGIGRAAAPAFASTGAPLHLDGQGISGGIWQEAHLPDALVFLKGIQDRFDGGVGHVLLHPSCHVEYGGEGGENMDFERDVGDGFRGAGYLIADFQQLGEVFVDGGSWDRPEVGEAAIKCLAADCSVARVQTLSQHGSHLIRLVNVVDVDPHAVGAGVVNESRGVVSALNERRAQLP